MEVTGASHDMTNWQTADGISELDLKRQGYQKMEPEHGDVAKEEGDLDEGLFRHSERLCLSRPQYHVLCAPVCMQADPPPHPSPARLSCGLRPVSDDSFSLKIPPFTRHSAHDDERAREKVRERERASDRAGCRCRCNGVVPGVSRRRQLIARID